MPASNREKKDSVMAKQKTLTKPSKSFKAAPTHRTDGEVVSVGESGQLITSIENGCLVDVGSDDSVTVKFADHITVGVFPEDHGQPDATLVASRGGSGFLEIEIVGISISEMLGIRAGVPVSVTW